MGVGVTEDRNARLDQLQKDVEAWADKRETYLKNQVAFAKRVLVGRTGSDHLTNASVQRSTELVVDKISEFLTGEKT